MATIVHALFERPEQAEAAVAELGKRTPEHPNFSVQTHDRGPLDGNFLPESATEIGRNTVIAMVVGGIVGLVLGGLAGATLDIMGLTFALGSGLGLITGILIGLLGGIMAGTRQPKAALRELAQRLGEGRVLVTVEVDDPGHVELVEGVLERFEADELGAC